MRTPHDLASRNTRRRSAICFTAFFIAQTTALYCSADDIDDSGDSTTPFVICESPRPEMCTQQYDPVCGRRSDDSRKTYSNACHACADIDVHGYETGAC
jgi:hypothetical protein